MTNDLEGWLEAVASGQAGMSQRGVRWVEARAVWTLWSRRQRPAAFT